MACSSESQDGPVALVVDDDAITRLLIRRIVEQMGFTVVEAADGEIAVREFRLVKPTIVITDINMPNMDGLTAIGEMRKIGDSDDVPVIVLSGIDDKKTIKEAYEVGVTEYLQKPINLARLRNAVSSTLSLSQLSG